MREIIIKNEIGSGEVLQVRRYRGKRIVEEANVFATQTLYIKLGAGESLRVLTRSAATGRVKARWRTVAKAQGPTRKPTKKKPAMRKTTKKPKKKPAKRKTAKKRKKNPCPPGRGRSNPKKRGPGVKPPAEWLYYKVATIKKRDKKIGAPAAVAGKIWSKMADSTRARIMRNVAKAGARRGPAVVTSYGILTRAQVVKAIGKRAADSVYKKIGKR